MSTHKPSLKTILCGANDVITSNSTHFSILSLVFLLPTFILILSLQISTSAYNSTGQWRDHCYLLLVFALSIVFSLCAKASITYSAFLAYYDLPVSIITSLKAILHSFLPLLATYVAANIVYGSILLAFAGVTYSLYNFLALLGIDVDYNSWNLIILVLLMTSLLLIVLIYFGLNWYLTNTVVVIESKWGFAPLRRSSYLSKGMSGTLFSMMILLGVISMVLSLLGTRVIANNAGRRFTSWEFLLQMTILAVFVTLYWLYSVVTSVVLFVRCKDLLGKFEGVASDYVRLGGEYEQVTQGVDVV